MRRAFLKKEASIFGTIIGKIRYIPNRRSLIVLFAVVFITVGIIVFPKLDTILILINHHYSECTLCESFKGILNSRRNRSLEKKYSNQIRLVYQDELGHQLWETPEGEYWMPYGNNERSIPLLLAEKEQKIYTLGSAAVHPGDVVIDCGAHVGFFTRAALESGAKKVVAIEIAPPTIECLRRNFSKEIDSGSVIICEKGVWDRDDFLDLYLPDNTARATLVESRIEASQKARIFKKIALTTLDKIVDELHLDQVDLIKMDIEGAERRAVTGASRTLMRFKPRLSISVYHTSDDLEVIPSLVREIRSDYLIDCGPCVIRDGRLAPNILYFH